MGEAQLACGPSAVLAAQLSKSPAERSRSAERSRLVPGLADRRDAEAGARVAGAAGLERERAQRQRRHDVGRLGARPLASGRRPAPRPRGAAARRPSVWTDSLPERFSSPSSDARAERQLGVQLVGVVDLQRVGGRGGALPVVVAAARGTRAARACCIPNTRPRRRRCAAAPPGSPSPTRAIRSPAGSTGWRPRGSAPARRARAASGRRPASRRRATAAQPAATSRRQRHTTRAAPLHATDSYRLHREAVSSSAAHGRS